MDVMNINNPPSASLRNKRNHSQISMALRSSSNPTSSSTSLMNGENSGEGSTIESRGSSAPPLGTSGENGVFVADEDIKMEQLGLVGEEDDRPSKVRKMNGNGVGSSNGLGKRVGNGEGDEFVQDDVHLDLNAPRGSSSYPRMNSEEFDLMISKVDAVVEREDEEMKFDDQSVEENGGQSMELETPTEGGGEQLHEELANELTCGMCAGLFVEPLTLTPCGHAFCGSCIVLWLKSFQPNHLLTYTNPTPTLQSQLAFARERDMYGDAPFANGVAAIASGPIDAASVNGILGGGLGGVHPTPIEGLSCPQCRLMPVVDAAPNIILKSLIEVLIKHHPDMARTTEEIAQMKATYKRGDLLSFPQPPRALTGGGVAAGRSRDRLIGVSYWGPCPYCRPLREGEVSMEDGGSRYICPLPIPDPSDPAQAERALRSDGMVPDGHRMCSVCQQLCPEALAQSCGICGDGCCGSRNRCQLPKLEEAVLNESSFQVLDTMRGWVKDEAWSRWQDYLGVFQYNFVELAYFLAYVQAQYVRTHPVPTAVPPPPMVDNVMPVQNEGILVPEAQPTPTLAVLETPEAVGQLTLTPASANEPAEATVADDQPLNGPLDLNKSVAPQVFIDPKYVVGLASSQESTVEPPPGDAAIGSGSTASATVEGFAIERAAVKHSMTAEPSVEESLNAEHLAPQATSDQPAAVASGDQPAVSAAPALQGDIVPPVVPLLSSVQEKPITTTYICQSIARWLMSDEGFTSGGLDGMCKRADKEGLVRADSVPERLCNTCCESFFCAGMFEFWMRESKKESVQERIPEFIKGREPCKNGRACVEDGIFTKAAADERVMNISPASCPYQSNLEHSRTYSHLSEKLSPELMESMAHQSAPVVTDQEEDDFKVLCHTVKDARELFGLAREPPVPVQLQQPSSHFDDDPLGDENSEDNSEDDQDDEDDRDNSREEPTYANIGVQTDTQPPSPIQPTHVDTTSATVLPPNDVHLSSLPILSLPSSPVLQAIKKDFHPNGNDNDIIVMPDALTAVAA